MFPLLALVCWVFYYAFQGGNAKKVFYYPFQDVVQKKALYVPTTTPTTIRVVVVTMTSCKA